MFFEFRKGLLTIVVALWVAVGVVAQEEVKVEAEEETTLYTKQFCDSYDSLMKSYYMRSYNIKEWDGDVEALLTEFDRVPDSVIMERLARLKTIVPMTFNTEVRNYIRAYLRNMSTRLERTVMLNEYYHPLFEKELSTYGVPEEVKYLAIIESAMNPNATSRVGAAGLWQFMSTTGRMYGMEVNSVVDDRRDVYKSTTAAARYIRHLYDIFNDWTLAIAAYNCGPGNINKAIARSGGKRTFWEIYPYLPRETRGYIPALIGVTYVMNYHDEHGLHITNLSLPVHTDTIMLHNDVLMTYVAKVLDMEMESLRTLNTQYRVDYIPASAKPYPLTLPIDKLETFIANEDSVYAWSKDSLSRRPIKIEANRGKGGARGGGGNYYVVRKGDTLNKIAQKHGTTVAALKKRNGLKNDNIRVGQKIRVR